MFRSAIRRSSPRPDSAGEIVRTPFPWLFPTPHLLQRLDPTREATLRDLAMAERQRDARTLWAYNAGLVGAFEPGLRWFVEALALDAALQKQAMAAWNRSGDMAEA